MNGMDATLIVAAPIVLLCVLAGIGGFIDRRFLGGEERRAAAERSQARRLR